MLMKAFRFVMSVYLFIILFPYIMVVFFYGIFKFFAKEGSRLDAQLGKLENDLINTFIDAAKNIDLNVLFLNIMGMILFMFIVAILKKHKFLVPRKKSVEIEVPNH